MHRKILPIAICSATRAATIALAACAFEVAVGDDGLATVQVFPAGKFSPADGRPMTTDGWTINQAQAAKVIERFRQRKTPMVIDYEHQTLRAEDNGQPAPAAAWFKELEWREGEGLFATIELTARAREAVNNKEYLFFSPVHRYHPKTGEVMELVMGALTNNPAIDGMEELSLRAAATFGATLEDETVDLLQKLLAKLDLDKNTTEEQALAALSKRLDADPLVGVKKALGEKDDADAATVVAACTALKAKAEQGEPDPTQYVPVSALNSLKSEVASLSQQLKGQQDQQLESLIDEALEDGRLVKGMEDWARDLGKKDMAALNKYLETSQPIAALRGSQTRGESPVDEGTGLTEDELAVCSRMGVKPEDFKKYKTDGTGAAA